MIILEFPDNPFKELVPGGSPSEPFTNPPFVELKGISYMVKFYWDRAMMEKRQTQEALEKNFQGVDGQAIVRSEMGDEFYVRTFTKGGCGFWPTGFSGAKFKTIKEEMHPLDRFKLFILDEFNEGDQAAVKEAIEPMKSLVEIVAYLQWAPEEVAEILQRFLSK